MIPLKTTVMLQRFFMILSFYTATIALAFAEDQSSPLEFTKWSGSINVPDPVAISLDHQGRAYVTQTQRRKSQDLDIRANRDWIASDVGLQSVAEKRAFFRKQLDPKSDYAKKKKRVDDLNDDGSHDYRDLMVLSERIHVVEDTDGDGVADRTGLFADGFRTEVTGIAAGVLWHGGDVFATIAPDVWRLRDTNNDGKADEREVIATGFGLHIAYAGHDMHGLTVGPDGKIYWTVGDKGISATSKEGRKFHYPNQGGVMRCNPDGTDFEVFAHGLRNVQELAFDEFGNLFGVDNDADKPGERERVVYVVKGMDAGWRCNYQYRGDGYNPWLKERLWELHHAEQPAYITPPLAYSLNGPAGFAYNPGTALGPQWQRHFFLTGAPGGEQVAFQANPSGASFSIVNERKVGKGIPIVGINFGPDGALYGVDWGGGYPLNQKGAIWKIDSPKDSGSPLRREVQQLLANGFRNHAVDRLVELLSHADQRIRLAAQFELVRREADDEIETVAVNSESLLARIHAIWALGQRLRNETKSSEATIAGLLDDKEAEIRAQAARTIGDLRRFDGDKLLPLLRDAEPRVRFFAAIALGTHKAEGARNSIATMLAENNCKDLYLRHAGIIALTNCQDVSKLVDHPSQAVRLAAVVALRRNADSAVARFLDDESELVVAEATRAIHDDWSITEAVPALASLLAKTSSTNESVIRRAINASFRLGQPGDAVRIAKFVARDDVAQGLRLDGLHSLSQWNDPPVLDRVDGRNRREKVVRSIDTKPLAPLVSQLLLDRDSQVAAKALATAGALNINISEQNLVKLVASNTASQYLRVEALTLLNSQKSAKLTTSIQTAISSDAPRLRVVAMKLLTKSNPAEALPYVENALKNSRNQFERQQAAMLLGQLGIAPADEFLSQQLANLSRGESIRRCVWKSSKRLDNAHRIHPISPNICQHSKSNAKLPEPKIRLPRSTNALTAVMSSVDGPSS